jgi:hypothetical protein
MSDPWGSKDTTISSDHSMESELITWKNRVEGARGDKIFREEWWWFLSFFHPLGVLGGGSLPLGYHSIWGEPRSFVHLRLGTGK